MNITTEEKASIVEQIANLTTSHPYFYLKFCSCEEFAKDVCNGNLFGNTAEYFRQREIETGERGQGDRFELSLSLPVQNIKVYDNKTGDLTFTASNGTYNVQHENDDKLPIVSFVGIPLNEMELIGVYETYADFKFPFTNDEYSEMTKKFGEYCVVIDGILLKERIDIYCNQNSIKYIFDKVKYCDPNTSDRMNAFNEGLKERFIYKNIDLSYQREYRLVVGIEMPEGNFIKLDNLVKYDSILKSEELKNKILRVMYRSNQKE